VFPAHKGSYHFGEFQLNLDLRVLVRQGQRVPLGPKAYDVLTCLVVNAGQVISKGDLLKEVWAESYVEDGTLAQHVFSLRKALGDKSDYIATVPGHGYRFAGTVRHVLPDTSPVWSAGEGVLHEVRERTHMIVEEPMPQVVVAAKPAPWRLYAVVAVGIVALFVAGWLWSRRAVPRDHIGVVLADFGNTTGDAAFDRTLGRALEIDLSQSPYLDVMSEREGVTTLGLMGLKADAALSPAVAREMCERTNRQVVLTGNISSVSDEYLVTVEADDCRTGKKVASAKDEVAGKVKVLGALDSVAEKVRSKLGESAKSIGGFDVPLQQAATPSLEALKAYSIGKHLQAQGNGLSESTPLFQRAIELDPQFAQAYGEMAANYYNLSEPKLAEQYMKKAYDLRTRVDVQDRLTFEAHYLGDVLGDMPASVKVYQLWADTYPHDWVPWLDAANTYQQLSRYADAINAGQRALAVEQNVLTYVVLDRAYKSANRFAEAKALGQEAVRQGKDCGALHALLLEIAFAEHDASAFDREAQLMTKFNNSYHDYYLAIAASTEGNLAKTENLFHSEIAADRQAGFAELADNMLVEEAGIEIAGGLPDVARVTLAKAGKGVEDSPDFAIVRAGLGDTGPAERYLAVHRNDPHPSTGLQYAAIPQIEATLAMKRGKPLEAVSVLSPLGPFGVHSISTLVEIGDDYLQAGQPDQAAARYREAIANPGRGFGMDYPMAHLGLARAYAKVGDRADARAEYENFLALWKAADPDLPPLVAAKAELARLR
jgi:DNA-binding winged helix-turn-helix (wHTH) protein/tetratricopeptide (TPR) repeat protein